MKNLLIYISPTHSFDNPREGLPSKEAEKLAKIQIENSLQLGWKARDIMLITNFKWQYGPVKAKVMKDVEFNEKYPKASKISAIVALFEKNKIKDKEVYWYHDLDAFQLEKITKPELKLGKADMALTEYDKTASWSTGSIFFSKRSKDIFEKIKEIMNKDNIDDERALLKLIRKDKKIKKRIKKLNKTYNFTPLNLNAYYKKANKPIKVAHFHPLGKIPQLGAESALKFYLGENKLQTPLITDRLYKIFRYHRIG